ncbi:hypothetical protein MMEU_2477 [Mycobacterium marinum str. Europe]|nr:hypothetical protein MMEU_2477 [Mycobacterium marinum str. Europe]
MPRVRAASFDHYLGCNPRTAAGAGACWRRGEFSKTAVFLCLCTLW